MVVSPKPERTGMSWTAELKSSRGGTLVVVVDRLVSARSGLYDLLGQGAELGDQEAAT